MLFGKNGFWNISGHEKIAKLIVTIFEWNYNEITVLTNVL